MVYERPKKKEQKHSPANSKRTIKNNPVLNHGNGNNNGNQPVIPSPWLDADNEPSPENSASFVEYLRWMRPAENDYKDATKTQILQMAENNANYSQRLQLLNKRTKRIAGNDNTFQVKSTWRIRVGGHRGPESILLPAFDALGIPYIPSSTLRGVARTQAILEIVQKNSVTWKEAEKQIASYFGSVETKNKSNQAGKIIFLDAYPLANQSGQLAMDMVNNVWKWDNNSLQYSSNPSPFLSLKEPTFLIGLKLASNCDDTQVLEQVKEWLITGLQNGVGSQINTGYGELIRPGNINRNHEFFRVEFTLQGQLIHGRQKFSNVNQPYQKDRDGHLKTDKNGKLKTNTTSEAEVRPTAFKSMLRYWFRAFALGVLETRVVQEWEGKLFGAINPSKQRGWVKANILNGKLIQPEPKPNHQGKNDDIGEQEGTLILNYSQEIPDNQKENIKKLFRNIVWFMFHLGGVGQGARRPCYSRQNRQYAPWWRGSTLIPESDDSLWDLPETVQEFQRLFQRRLRDFYQILAQITQVNINQNQPRTAGISEATEWTEAVDSNCRIIVCNGEEDFQKVYALAVLHSDKLKVQNNRNQLNYNQNLCGKVSHPVKPSPVWIADLDDYQVVTIFSATCEPRSLYLQKLINDTDKQNFAQIFPF